MAGLFFARTAISLTFISYAVPAVHTETCKHIPRYLAKQGLTTQTYTATLYNGRCAICKFNGVLVMSPVKEPERVIGANIVLVACNGHG
jgi:hypothetical protein